MQDSVQGSSANVLASPSPRRWGGKRPGVRLPLVRPGSIFFWTAACSDWDKQKKGDRFYAVHSLPCPLPRAKIPPQRGFPHPRCSHAPGRAGQCSFPKEWCLEACPGGCWLRSSVLFSRESHTQHEPLPPDAHRVMQTTKHGYHAPFTGHLVENYLALKALQRNLANDLQGTPMVAVDVPDHNAVNTVAIYLAALHVAVDAALLTERPRLPCLVYRSGCCHKRGGDSRCRPGRCSSSDSRCCPVCSTFTSPCLTNGRRRWHSPHRGRWREAPCSCGPCTASAWRVLRDHPPERRGVVLELSPVLV